jgi:hypothetical protein
VSDLREYDEVRVVRLLITNRDFNGTEGCLRAPAVGDTAIICHEYEPGNPDGKVAAERVDANGNTEWLADFEESELELVHRPDRGR